MTNKADEESISQLFAKHLSDLKYTTPLRLKSELERNLSKKKADSVSAFTGLLFGGGALATAASLILAFQLGKISSSPESGDFLTQEVISSHVRSLMANHLSDVVSTDQHTVKPWFEGKLDFGPNVKDFAKNGFPLIGGRLDYLDGRQTAAMVYKFNQHVINVFEFPIPSLRDSQPRLKSVRGYQVFNWSKDGMNYSVVSDVNAADLQRFVALWE